MSGVYHSLDNGVSWNNFNSGLPTIGTFGAGNFYETASYIFCGIEGGGSGSIFRIDKNQVISGIETKEQTICFSIFPNPANNSIKISTEIGNEIIITDVTGRKKISKKITTKNDHLSTNNFESGIYFVSLFDNENIISTQKLVVEK